MGEAWRGRVLSTSFPRYFDHLYTQSTSGVYGSEIQAETGTKGVCESANMSNEARVILKAGVPLPGEVPESAL